MRTLRIIGATVLAVALGFFNTASADEPTDRDMYSEVITRLDAILKRLDAIDQRLTIVEETQRRLSDWWIDDRGVMRSFNGRPIGHWGIDGPTAEVRR